MSTKKITKLIFTDFLIPKILRALLLKHITYLAHTKNMSSPSLSQQYELNLSMLNL